MVRRLVEVNYFASRQNPTAEQIRFWFLELRTPELLMELSQQRKLPATLVRKRPLLAQVKEGGQSALAKALRDEEQKERDADRLYWAPLKKELEKTSSRPTERPHCLDAKSTNELSRTRFGGGGRISFRP